MQPKPARRAHRLGFAAGLLAATLVAAAIALLAAERVPLPWLVLAIPACAAPPLALLLRNARRRIAALEMVHSSTADRGGRDALTGLPDRASFEERLQMVIARSSPTEPVALVVIGVDRFASINDTHGRQAGDRLLFEIVERVRGVLRQSDGLARIGSDEFALVVPGVSDGAHVARLTHRILDSMVAAFDLGVAQVHAGVSLGVAFAPQDGTTTATVLQAADLALSRAKHDGRGRFASLDTTMEPNLGRTLETDLQRAIHAGELTIAYQPLVDGRDERMIAVEALVRWQHPSLGPIPPEDFIPLAESRGLIVPLGEWVLRTACLEARRWPSLRLSVNVSPVQFRQPGFVDRVEAILDAAGMDPDRLDLEVTEGVLIQDADQAEAVMVELRAMGIRLSLDDFGSGYSSMIYLRRFAFDKVKIDRAFLQSLEMNGEGAIILEYIVSLGHALGLKVTAEGVERPEHVAFLKKLGCDELQGYLFAPPLSPGEIDERLSLSGWMAGSVEAPASPVGRDAA